MKRRPYLTEEEARALYDTMVSERLTIAEMARRTGRDKSALYRLFNRKFGHKVGHATGFMWAPTLKLPDDPAMIGYLAGIIDGEGSIGLVQGKYHTVRVGMTDENVMRYLHSIGGTLHAAAARENRKPTWHWSLARKADVIVFLRAIEPYVIVKRDKLTAALRDLEGA